MRGPEESFSVRPRLTPAEESLRPTRAEVDLSSIAHNYAELRRVVAPSRAMAVVKADAYGHGVVPVAKRLGAEGADGFGVALAEEGIELRDAGVDGTILVLNGVYGGAHREVLEAGLTPVIYDLADVAAFARVSGDRPFSFHLKVDTGMARLGVPVKHLGVFLDGLAEYPTARIDGFMTHLSSADTDLEYTRQQLERFESALSVLRARGHSPTTVHAANSAAAAAIPTSRYDLVRPGIALFGYSLLPKGDGEKSADIRLRPAMRLRTEVIALRDVGAGDRVGYDGTFVASESLRIATLPLGYGDGLIRRLGNRGHVLVSGRRCPIVGRVSMDLTTVDVSAIDDVAVGDEVVLLGSQGQEQILADEIAAHADTIAYEVLTSVSRRVPRFYV